MRGFVLVDKPRGPTSHDVVDMVRRALGIRRVGHAGTLDPPASGLLVLGVGGATRLVHYVQELPKTYEVTAALGVRTSTLDATGEVLTRTDPRADPAAVRAACARLIGEIDQVPPAISALKVGGERAWRRARRGEAVELVPRRVHVYAFDVLRTSRAAFDARVCCSSGTYVRSLVRDVGEVLGCGAHVVSLRRTAIGHLLVSDAVPPQGVDASRVRPVEEVLSHLPRLDVGAKEAARAAQGRPLAGVGGEPGEVLVVGPEGAVGVFRSEGDVLRPLTVLGPH